MPFPVVTPNPPFDYRGRSRQSRARARRDDIKVADLGYGLVTKLPVPPREPAEPREPRTSRWSR